MELLVVKISIEKRQENYKMRGEYERSSKHVKRGEYNFVTISRDCLLSCCSNKLLGLVLMGVINREIFKIGFRS